jgi:dTMP kinase
VFITFEGMDGAGKTTQIRMLQERLEAAGQCVLVTREPGGNAVAETIRAVLLDPKNDMDPLTEAYLYAAARAEHVRAVIRPALARGETVLCDRYLDSSLAYQGYGRGLGEAAVREINARAAADCVPDRTYLLLLPETAAESRVRARGPRDRIESAGDAFLRRVEAGFRALAAREPARICAVDASGSPEEIARRIAEDVANLQTRKAGQA